MAKRLISYAAIILSTVVLFACNTEKPVELELSLSVKIDGKAASDAHVAIDGEAAGQTGPEGKFIKRLKRLPGQEVSVSVKKEASGYDIEPWQDTFVTKLSGDGIIERYSFEVNLTAKKFVTLSVTSGDTPIEGATVYLGNKPIGKTDANGRMVHTYTTAPKSRFNIRVRKNGYRAWQKTVAVRPGQDLDISLKKASRASAAEMSESDLPTDGSDSSAQKAKTKKTSASAKSAIKRHLNPATPPIIKVGMYGYINNSPEAGIDDTIGQIEEAVRRHLFIYRSFREVPKPSLHAMMMQDTLDMQNLSTKGWQDTPMSKSVDMILSGTVTKDTRGLAIESTITTADGKILLSQINTARNPRDIPRTSKIIAASIIDQFPFEGTVTAVEPDGYRINLGQHNYKIRRGNIFRYMAAKTDRNGKITGYEEQGLLRVVETADTHSKVEVASLKKNQTIRVGDKVIRRVYLEEEREAAKNSFVLIASGGTPGQVKPLWGVNVYLNNTWVGTTGADGKAEIPVYLQEQYDLLLSRHGYQPVRTPVSISQDKAVQAYTLEVANAVLKIDSEPSLADVFVDDVLIGKTPIQDGKLVNFGFRKLRVSVGGDYRDWQQVVEINKSEVDYMGAKKIRLLKDYYKIGQMAEQDGNPDKAIVAYAVIDRQNPDYSDARSRLAQLYMDDKGDFEKASQEFENVLSLPENRQIIYKQFAITYTNLGHAYYELGNQLIWKDKAAAAQYFAKAIEKLKIAKQNTRFFPSANFSQAVHDTYYYLAISTHKLYLLTRKSTLLHQASQAWREYFDFYPKQLEGNQNFEKIRKAARQYWDQIKELS
jgi:tetratricopeptide (TPR) repeat protein